VERILVIGSSNTDMVVKTDRFPGPGETVLGGTFFMFPGGKGANQAVAAARLGANVSFICAVGNDLFGVGALEHYRKEGLDLSAVYEDSETASGVALITINSEGENEIVVAPGANSTLTEVHIKNNMKLVSTAKLILTQLETPVDVVCSLSAHCRKSGQRLILNPAPAREFPNSVLEDLFLLTPNQSEAEQITSVPVTDKWSAEKACHSLLEKGVQNVIITMGNAGSFFMNAETKFMTGAPRVEVKDTTAAGDIFNGALAVAISEDKQWPEAIQFATKAAALSVSRMGAQHSAPYLNEMK
jgi:ribokinase